MLDDKLEKLRREERISSCRLRKVSEKYTEAKRLASEAYAELEKLYAERCRVRRLLNDEYDLMQCVNRYRQKSWDEYHRIKDYNDSLVAQLRTEAYEENRAMVECFELAKKAYDEGKKDEAKSLSEEGYRHRSCRNLRIEQVKECRARINYAKRCAEMVVGFDKTNFYALKKEFEVARDLHKEAQDYFKRLKDERNRIKIEFDRVREEHDAKRRELARAKRER